MLSSEIIGAIRLPDNYITTPDYKVHKLIKLQCNQVKLLPPHRVMCSYITTDRGARGILAKRWYQWFTSAETIFNCPKSTELMIWKAEVIHGKMSAHQKTERLTL